jgi:hypothetical protein
MMRSVAEWMAVRASRVRWEGEPGPTPTVI